MDTYPRNPKSYPTDHKPADVLSCSKYELKPRILPLSHHSAQPVHRCWKGRCNALAPGGDLADVGRSQGGVGEAAASGVGPSLRREQG